MSSNNRRTRPTNMKTMKKTALIRATINSQMKVLHWNAGGLSQPKMTEIQDIANKNEIDVILINEANVSAENVQYYNIKKFNIYTLNKTRQIASGILVATKDTLKTKFKIITQDNNNTAEMVEITIWKENKQFKIYSVYSPPKNKELQLDKINITRATIIMGDFNAASTNWGYKYYNKSGKVVENFINSNNLELLYNEQEPKTFLHYSGTGTNPDLTIVSSDIYDNSKRTVLEDIGSGHRAVMLTVSYKPIRTKPHNKISWNFRKAKWTKFQETIDSACNEINLQHSPHKIVKAFNNIIIKTAKQYIPRGKQRTYNTFWTRELTTQKKTRDDKRKKAENSKAVNDVILWRKESAKLKQMIVSAKRESWNKFLHQMNYKTDGQKAYRLLNTLNNKHSLKRSQPFNINSKEITNNKSIANHFNKSFSANKLSKTSKQRDKKLHKLNKTVCETSEETMNREFSKEELKEAIRTTKTKKQPGPDNIFPEFIKHLGPNALKILLKIYNMIWTSNSKIPQEWTKAIITPVLKPGKPANLFTSYRPIALTSVLAKIQERMVMARLNWFMEKQHILKEEQAGFRKNRSTAYQLTKLTHSIKTAFNKNESALAIFVDFKGAYDTVWRNKLLYKLQQMDIKGKMLSWFKRFLSDRRTAVKYETAISNYKLNRVGLPQGSVTSTSLFNAYINDLPGKLKAVKGIQVESGDKKFLKVNGTNQMYLDEKSGSWIGGAMDMDEEDGRIAVCGHRWRNVQKRDKFDYMLGVCYWSKFEQSTTDAKGVNKLIPLFDPDKYFTAVKTNKFGLLNYGAGQAGMSVHFPKKKNQPELLVGAPGVDNWKGTTIIFKDSANSRDKNYDKFGVTNPRNLQEISRVGIAQYSLFGYQVNSGRFTKADTLYYVASNPKGMKIKGGVFIYEYGYNSYDIIVRKTVSGLQLGEYFGSSLAVADINCDGTDDLIVGAPQYTLEHDEGCIYIFYSNLQTTIFSQGIRITGKIVGGRFGSSVVALGDLDMDGCQDIAVGAPYANNQTGVVYIYNGGYRGPVLTQEISASKIDPNLQGFGISVSRAADIDGNKYPDVAVGAYLSGHVVLFRTLPVVSLITKVSSNVTELKRDSIGFSIRVCLFYEAMQPPSTLNVSRTVTVDERYGRAHFSDKRPSITSVIVIKNQRHCEDLEVFLLNTALENSVDPVTVKVTQELIQNETRSVILIGKVAKGESEDGFRNENAVLNKANSTTMAVASVPFEAECGDVCESELQLNSSFSGLMKGGYIIGSKSKLKLLLNVTNYGEPAYMTKVTINIPSPILLSSGNKQCKESHSIFGSFLTCDFGNPLRNGTVKNLTVNLNTDNVKAGYENVTFYISISTSSKDKNRDNNVQRLHLDFIIDADVIITGKTEEWLHSYQKNNRTIFNHKYEVQKKGESSVDVVEAVLEIPYSLKGENGVVNFLDLFSPLADFKGQQLQCQPEGDFNFYVEENDDKVETLDIISREKRETTTEVLNVNQTLFLNCSVPYVKCVTIKCLAGPFDSGTRGSATIELKMIMNTSKIVTMLDPSSRPTIYVLSTYGSVSIKEPHVILAPNRLHNAIVNATFINGTYFEAPAKKVETWIIALSIIAGVLIFMFVTIALMKAGFFERKKKEELKSLMAIYAENVFASGPVPLKETGRVLNVADDESKNGEAKNDESKIDESKGDSINDSQE